MVIYLLEVKCKVYLLFLIPDQDGHGFQFKIVQKVNVQKIDLTLKSQKISKIQVIQKLLIMGLVVLKGGL
jgi:hypothetical protein